MKNSFFRQAFRRAYSVVGNRGRLLSLAYNLTKKASREHVSISFWQDRLFLIGRLLKAFAKGQYRAIPLRSVVLILAAVIYFINPLDLVPDAIFGLGLTDDLAILTGVYNLVSKELENFRIWETNLAAT